MSDTQANCPKCKAPVALADSALSAPAGKVAYVVCPSCTHRAAAVDFTRQTERLQRDAAHSEKQRLRADQLNEHRYKKEQDREAKRLAKKKRNEEAERARNDFFKQQNALIQQQEEEGRQRREEEKQREAELMTNRTLNEKDIEAITEAVAKGIVKRREHYKTVYAADAFFRVASFLLFLGFALGAADSNGPAAICSAIFAAIFFWFTFRFRL